MCRFNLFLPVAFPDEYYHGLYFSFKPIKKMNLELFWTTFMHMMYIPIIRFILLERVITYIGIGKRYIQTLPNHIPKLMRDLFEADMSRKNMKDGMQMNGSIYFVN